VVDPGGAYQLHGINQAWSEATADWSIADNFSDPIAQFTLASLGEHTVEISSGGLSVVQSWLDGTSNYGLLLKTGGTSNGLDVKSRESGSGAELNIIFEPPSDSAPVLGINKTDHLIEGINPIGTFITKVVAKDWQGDALSYRIINDVPFSIDSGGNIYVESTLPSSGGHYLFDVGVSDGANEVLLRQTIQTTAVTAAEDALLSGEINDITTAELLAAALTEIESGRTLLLDAKRQIFNLNSDGSARSDGTSLNGLNWNPTHDSAILATTHAVNTQLLISNVSYRNKPVVPKPLAIIGEKFATRYLVMAGNPLRNMYWGNESNPQLDMLMENSLSWLTGRSGLKTTPINVVIAQMDQSYYFPDEVATRNWLDRQYPGQVTYNSENGCDGQNMAACLQQSTDLLIISQIANQQDDVSEIVSAVEQAMERGIPVLYMHHNGDLMPLGSALLKLLDVGYEADNYWNRFAVENYDPLESSGSLPALVEQVATLLAELGESNYTFDWSFCIDSNCSAVPGLAATFNQLAAVRSIITNLDKGNRNIFAGSGDRLSKFLVLIGDSYRQKINYPMDKIATDSNQFIKALYADSSVYNYRTINPAQPDLGNFSRSDFSHISPTTRTVTTISKRNFRATGAYALPGKTVRVTRRDTSSELTVKVFINTQRSASTHHMDNYGYKRPKYLQSAQMKIRPGETIEFTSPYGGPIQLLFSVGDLPVDVTFDNVGEHAYWGGEQDNASFGEQLIAGEFDWAELSTPGFEVHSTLEKMRLSVVSNNNAWGGTGEGLAAATMRYMYNYPHVLAGFQGPGIDVVPEIHDFSEVKGWSINNLDMVKHMNADQAACGYGCSGNPYDAYWSFNPIGHGDVHELGHGLQGGMRFDGWGGHSMTNPYSYYTKSKYREQTKRDDESCQNLSFKEEFGILQKSVLERDSAKYMQTNLWDDDDWNRRATMFIQMLMSAQNSGAVENGWHVRARLHIMEREFNRAVKSESLWLSKRDSFGLGNYTLSEANNISNNDWLAIAISVVTERDYRDYLNMWALPFSSKAADQIASLGYPSVARKFYISSASGYCKTGQNGDFLGKASLPVDGNQVWPEEIDSNGDGYWDSLKM
ncbi:MAG: ImpA family metalloprotease, partial [Sedimenticola sp.]